MNSERGEFIIQLGKQIKKIRCEKKMTQLDVAVKADMEENAFQRIEAGRTNPTTKTLFKITRALECNFLDIFNFDN